MRRDNVKRVHECVRSLREGPDMAEPVVRPLMIFSAIAVSSWATSARSQQQADCGCFQGRGSPSPRKQVGFDCSSWIQLDPPI